MNLLKKILWLLLAGALVLGVASCDDDDDDDDDDIPNPLAITAKISTEIVTAVDLSDGDKTVTLSATYNGADATVAASATAGKVWFTLPEGDAAVTGVAVSTASVTFTSATVVATSVTITAHYRPEGAAGDSQDVTNTITLSITPADHRAALTTPTLTQAAGTGDDAGKVVVTISNAATIKGDSEFDSWEVKVDGAVPDPVITVDATAGTFVITPNAAGGAAKKITVIAKAKVSSTTKKDSEASAELTVAAAADTRAALTTPTLTQAAGTGDDAGKVVVTISNAATIKGDSEFDSWEVKVDGAVPDPVITVDATAGTFVITPNAAGGAAKKITVIAKAKVSSTTKKDSEASAELTVAAAADE